MTRNIYIWNALIIFISLFQSSQMSINGHASLVSIFIDVNAVVDVWEFTYKISNATEDKLNVSNSSKTLTNSGQTLR